VTVRPVTLGPVDGENVAVETGLKPGEVVVVNGADKLREGAKVEVTLQQAPSPLTPLPQGEGNEKKGRSGFATPTETFAGRKDSQNVSAGIANPVTQRNGQSGFASPVTQQKNRHFGKDAEIQAMDGNR